PLPPSGPPLFPYTTLFRSLIIELDGLEAGLDTQAAEVIELCRRNAAREVRTASSPQERADLWKSRKRAFGAIGRLSPNFLTQDRSEEHTSELQSRVDLVCR